MPLQASTAREPRPRQYLSDLMSSLPTSLYFTNAAGLVQDYADYVRPRKSGWKFRRGMNGPPAHETLLPATLKVLPLIDAYRYTSGVDSRPVCWRR
jgi:hypothetical protein